MGQGSRRDLWRRRPPDDAQPGPGRMPIDRGRCGTALLLYMHANSPHCFRSVPQVRNSPICPRVFLWLPPGRGAVCYCLLLFVTICSTGYRLVEELGAVTHTRDVPGALGKYSRTRVLRTAIVQASQPASDHTARLRTSGPHLNTHIASNQHNRPST